jgi:hypothetical protein
MPNADLTKVVQLLCQLVVTREALNPTLAYSIGKITTVRDPEFRKRVLKAYGYSERQWKGLAKTMPCLVLGLHVPRSSLVVGHLFKHEWAPVAGSTLVRGV